MSKHKKAKKDEREVTAIQNGHDNESGTHYRPFACGWCHERPATLYYFDNKFETFHRYFCGIECFGWYYYPSMHYRDNCQTCGHKQPIECNGVPADSVLRWYSRLWRRVRGRSIVPYPPMTVTDES